MATEFKKFRVTIEAVYEGRTGDDYCILAFDASSPDQFTDTLSVFTERMTAHCGQEESDELVRVLHTLASLFPFDKSLHDEVFDGKSA